MAAEQQSGAEYSFSYSAFCERLSSVHGNDLVYAGDPCGRAALEVLWLKLSLLVEAVQAASLPEFNLGACRITLDPSTKHLPLVWTFRLSGDSSASQANTTTFSAAIGKLWLSTLLANQQQDAARIHSVVTEMVNACGSDADRLVKAIFASPVFGVNQLVSSATADTCAAVPAGIWRDVIMTGLRLATRIPTFSYAAEGEEFTETIRARVSADCIALQARAKRALFIDPPLMEKNLREILVELIDNPQWLDALSSTPEIAVKPERARPASEAPPLPPQVPVAEQENAEATIIIKRGAHAPAAPARAPSPTPAASGSAPNVSRPAAPPPEEPENLEATIIISKDKKR